MNAVGLIGLGGGLNTGRGGGGGENDTMSKVKKR